MLAAIPSNDFFVAVCHSRPVPLEKIQPKRLKCFLTLPDAHTSKPKSARQFHPYFQKKPSFYKIYSILWRSVAFIEWKCIFHFQMANLG